MSIRAPEIQRMALRSTKAELIAALRAIVGLCHQLPKSPAAERIQLRALSAIASAESTETERA